MMFYMIKKNYIHINWDTLELMVICITIRVWHYPCLVVLFYNTSKFNWKIYHWQGAHIDTTQAYNIYHNIMPTIRCWATIKVTNKRCKNLTNKNQLFCHLHSKKSQTGKGYVVAEPKLFVFYPECRNISNMQF